jgi:hypothetical protein
MAASKLRIGDKSARYWGGGQKPVLPTPKCHFLTGLFKVHRCRNVDVCIAQYASFSGYRLEQQPRSLDWPLGSIFSSVHKLALQFAPLFVAMTFTGHITGHGIAYQSPFSHTQEPNSPTLQEAVVVAGPQA